jgi:hypothetical protein
MGGVQQGMGSLRSLQVRAGRPNAMTGLPLVNAQLSD